MLGRLAGGIRNFDNAYTQRVYDGIDNYFGGMENRAPNPVETVLGAAVKAGSGPITYKGEGNTLMQYATPIAGTGKYIVPGVGVTAAGVALYDLAQLMNQQSAAAIEP